MEIDVAVRVRALELLAAGESGREAPSGVGVSLTTVLTWAKLAGMVLQRGRLGDVSEPNERRRPPAHLPGAGSR